MTNPSRIVFLQHSERILKKKELPFLSVSFGKPLFETFRLLKDRTVSRG